MEDLKTYFFINGVAHEGKDKEWVRAEDVVKLMDEMGKETAECLAKGMKRMDVSIAQVTEAADKAAARIIELDKENKRLIELINTETTEHQAWDILSARVRYLQEFACATVTMEDTEKLIDLSWQQAAGELDPRESRLSLSDLIDLSVKKGE